MEEEVARLKRILSERLSMLIDESGLSQTEVGARSGISAASVTQYLDCSREAKAISIIKLARFFNVDIGWLLGETDERCPK